MIKNEEGRMSVFDKEERLLLPEWSRSQDALNTYEVKSLRSSFEKNLNDNTDVLYEEFVSNKKLGSAIELLNVAFIENREAESRIAAKFVVQGFDLPPQILHLARYVLKGAKDEGDISGEQKPIISILREWLRKNPKDSLGWLDLARAYVSIGKMEAAERAITVSLNLLPHHRWIVRVASRFFVNNHQNDKAHRILLKHPDIKEDPWLLSAEIAVAESYGRPLKMVSQARKVIESIKFSPSHLTELESSIATLELSNGLLKKAKKLYVSSLVKPNDNSLAQAKWAERNSNIPNLVSSELLSRHQGAYEAKLWEKYYEYDIQSAIYFGLKWFEDEPYSVQPAIMITYLASILDDYSLCLDVAKKGLNIDKNDETLILNKIFAELSLLQKDDTKNTVGFFNETAAILKVMADDKDTAAHANANLGLLYYKAGQPELGREYYDIAGEFFSKLKNASGLIAHMNHYRECIISMVPWSDDVFNRMSEEFITRAARKEPALIYYFMKMNLLKENPTDWDTIKKIKLDLSAIAPEKEKKEKVFTFDFDPEHPTISISRK